MPLSASPQAPDPRALREALGQFATGVAIVTMQGPNGPVGMTINSLAAVSLDPPLLLWSVQNDSASGQQFATARHYTISILAGGQELLARRFAQETGNRFADTPFLTGPSGGLVVAGARALFECQPWASYPGGDHQILVGQILTFATAPGPVLTFWQGRFGTLR